MVSSRFVAVVVMTSTDVGEELRYWKLSDSTIVTTKTMTVITTVAFWA